MKNRIKLLTYLLLILIFNFKNALTENFEYTANKVRILEKGNIIIGDGNIEVKIDDNIFIYAEKFKYIKNSGLLEITGNVKFKDTLQKLNASSSKITYSENSQLLKIIDDVKFIDNINRIELSTSKLNFSKKKNKVYSNTITNIIYDNEYNINLEDFEYDLNFHKINSKKLVNIKDESQNYFELNGFFFNTKLNKFLGNEMLFLDNQKNKYFLKDVMINTANKNIYGRNLDINFNKSIFGNNNNDPRLSAKSIKIKNQSSFLKKGVFTTCNDDADCPPWSIYAEEIEHDKNKQMIKYKNAWLKLYDVPTIYFPRFSHPDPTVNRKSGFLAPKFSSSKNLGSSINIPYFHVVSHNKDLTFNPKVFLDDTVVLQNEFRQVGQNSDHLIDFSLTPSSYLSSSNNTTKMHFYSNSNFDLNNSFFDTSVAELNLQKVNNDDYLKLYKIENEKLITDTNLLHSYFNLEGYKNDLSFASSIEVYEDLTKDKTSRYEFIYPKYELQKKIFSDDGNNIYLKSYGSQRNYLTNSYEGIVVNDFLYNSQRNYLDKGLVLNYNALVKNVNVDANNSDRFKDKFEQSLSTIFQYNTSYPLIKEEDDYLNYFTPKISLMYSPNKTKNLSLDNLRIDSSKIFSINRIANDETVEGGTSITYGTSFSKTKKGTNDEVLNFEIASLARLKENLDLPTSTTLGKKSSDVFGSFMMTPSNIFKLKYNFAIDNNFDKSNYDAIATTLSVNKFITTFEYSDEKNNLLNQSFTSNSSSYQFDNNNSINLNIRRNNDLSATEYYNLIYNYKNDCLTASVKFNKEFYQDSDLKPEKEIFFTLSIVPFGDANILN